MGSLIITVLQIYRWVCQWKNFENRLRNDRVTAISLVSSFFGTRCRNDDKVVKQFSLHLLSSSSLSLSAIWNVEHKDKLLPVCRILVSHQLTSRPHLACHWFLHDCQCEDKRFRHFCNYAVCYTLGLENSKRNKGQRKSLAHFYREMLY